MIKVLHISDKLSVGESTIHGVTRLFSWWIPRFDRNRFDVKICSLRHRDRAGEYLENLGVKVFYLNKGKFNPTTIFSLVQLINYEKINILHLHGYGAWTFGRLAGIISSVPLIVHEHMFDQNIPFYQQLVDRLLAKFTNHAIAVSDSVKEFMVKFRGLREDIVEVVENGIPVESFRTNSYRKLQSESAEIWRSKLRIPSNHKIVGTVGRLNPVKGHVYFIEAAQEVLRRYSSVTFMIIGDGELRDLLKEKVNQLGIGVHFRFTGHLDNVQPLLSIMDIMVIASLSEGGPITLFEAMASSCAVVSTTSIGLKNVIEEGQTGFLVPPKNSIALADKILLLLKDSELCQSMANSAQKLSSYYDIHSTVRKLEECYDKVAEKCRVRSEENLN